MVQWQLIMIKIGNLFLVKAEKEKEHFQDQNQSPRLILLQDF